MASPQKHVLIVDDEEAVCWALQRALGKEGYSAAVASSAEEAFGLVGQQRPDAIVLDVRLPGMDGLEALGRLRQITQDAPVIVITAHGNQDTAVRAVQGGAFDYLAKPFDLSQALETVARAVQHRKPAAPSETLPADDTVEEMVGRSPAMHNLFKRIALVAPRDACVLITGESGAGKELVARAIHRYSPRCDQPFLPVHIAALNPNLVESELFGHVKGAFTGAAQNRTGLLALADGGTVFLDELADIPMPVQVKLLRVLEQQEILPVGSTQPQRLQIRILGATHQDLSRRVAEGTFRHDLFFRLNVFQIHVPPLRERLEDIVPLCEHFLQRFEPRALPLPADTVKFLQSRPWLGNVRELRNALEHAAIVARGSPLRPEHFPDPVSAELGPQQVEERLRSAVRDWLIDRLRSRKDGPPEALHEQLIACVESTLLEEVIRRVHDNRWEAARWLGLNRATVRKKLGQYGLVKPDEEQEE
jgi:two-component system nitrogen regulation response regulator GlnG